MRAGLDLDGPVSTGRFDESLDFPALTRASDARENEQSRVNDADGRAEEVTAAATLASTSLERARQQLHAAGAGTTLPSTGFEQRGCGRSTPHASDPTTSLAANTTTHLVRDIEMLREHLGIDRWIINGVSWGSTLALAYAQAHPQRVIAAVLFAVTTTRRRDVDWVTEGVSAMFPEAWDRFAGHAEDAGIGYRRGRDRLVAAYSQLMESPDPGVREAASQEWALWEDTHISIGGGGFQRDPRWEDARFRHAFARLTTHYWSHDGFFDPPLLERMGQVHSLPAVLIHGRRDISEPAVIAWEVHQSWPGSELLIDESDGHGGDSMAQRWRTANDKILTH